MVKLKGKSMQQGAQPAFSTAQWALIVREAQREGSLVHLLLNISTVQRLQLREEILHER